MSAVNLSVIAGNRIAPENPNEVPRVSLHDSSVYSEALPFKTENKGRNTPFTGTVV